VIGTPIIPGQYSNTLVENGSIDLGFCEVIWLWWTIVDFADDGELFWAELIKERDGHSEHSRAILNVCGG
jgi:hypothetical protein